MFVFHPNVIIQLLANNALKDFLPVNKPFANKPDSEQIPLENVDALLPTVYLMKIVDFATHLVPVIEIA